MCASDNGPGDEAGTGAAICKQAAHNGWNRDLIEEFQKMKSYFSFGNLHLKAPPTSN